VPAIDLETPAGLLGDPTLAGLFIRDARSGPKGRVDLRRLYDLARSRYGFVDWLNMKKALCALGDQDYGVYNSSTDPNNPTMDMWATLAAAYRIAMTEDSTMRAGAYFQIFLEKLTPAPAPPNTRLEVAAVQEVEVLEFEVIPRELDGFTVWQRKSDGYWNATALCKAAGKEWYGYARNADNQKFMEGLKRSPQICGDLIQMITDGPNETRGTWVHRKVAIDLARWCSTDFAIQVNGWIDELLTVGQVSLTASQAPAFQLPQTMSEALRLCADTIDSNDRLTAQNNQLLTNNAELEAVTEELMIENAQVKIEKSEVEHSRQALQKTISGQIEGPLLSDWIGLHTTLHGHGDETGRRVLAAWS